MSDPPTFVAEQHVQLAARHFIRRGDIVYDVGANRGWLTGSFCRLTGSRGHVACFEASPRNIEILQSLVTDHRIVNAEIVGAAVYMKSNVKVDLYENPFSNTDSIYFRDTQARIIPVSTITLDDYALCTKLYPRLIKMDIEGAEYDALLGATAVLEQFLPILLIEMRKDDLRPFVFLKNRDYCAFNLRSFEALRDEADFSDIGPVEDVLFIHKEEMNRPENSFLLEADGKPFEDVASKVEKFGKLTTCMIPLEPGLSCVRVYSNARSGLEVACSVLNGGRCTVRSDGGYYLICEPYFSFTAYSEQADRAIVCMQVVSDDPAIDITGVKIKTIQLDPDSHRHHSTLNLLQPFGAPIEEILPILDECINLSRTTAFEEIADQIRRTNPSNPRLLYLSGIASMQHGKLDEAIELFERAMGYGFDSFWGNYRRALALDLLGRRVEAADAAHAADRVNPGNTDVNRLIASLATG